VTFELPVAVTTKITVFWDVRFYISRNLPTFRRKVFHPSTEYRSELLRNWRQSTLPNLGKPLPVTPQKTIIPVAV